VQESDGLRTPIAKNTIDKKAQMIGPRGEEIFGTYERDKLHTLIKDMLLSWVEPSYKSAVSVKNWFHAVSLHKR
jgi:hypothetical protein